MVDVCAWAEIFLLQFCNWKTPAHNFNLQLMQYTKGKRLCSSDSRGLGWKAQNAISTHLFHRRAKLLELQQPAFSCSTPIFVHDKALSKVFHVSATTTAFG